MDKLLEGILNKVKDVSPGDWKNENKSYKEVSANEGRLFASSCVSYIQQRDLYRCMIGDFSVSIERLRSTDGSRSGFKDVGYFLVVKDDMSKEKFSGKDVKKAFLDVAKEVSEYMELVRENEEIERIKKHEMKKKNRRKKLEDTFLG